MKTLGKTIWMNPQALSLQWESLSGSWRKMRKHNEFGATITPVSTSPSKTIFVLMQKNGLTKRNICTVRCGWHVACALQILQAVLHKRHYHLQNGTKIHEKCLIKVSDGEGLTLSRPPGPPLRHHPSCRHPSVSAAAILRVQAPVP